MANINTGKVKFSIQLCTHRETNPFFVNAFRQMEYFMHQTGTSYETSNEIGVSNLCSGREHRVQDALRSDATHVMFIDDDMVFPQDAAHQMLHTANMLTLSGVDKVAIGVNPVRKTMTGLYYTAKGIEQEGSTDFMASKGKLFPHEACRCGLSLFLIETKILREMEEPFFEILWGKEAKDHQGEDFYFIKKLRDHGVRVFVDQELSQKVGHVGHYIYGFSSYGPSATTNGVETDNEWAKT